MKLSVTKVTRLLTVDLENNNEAKQIFKIEKHCYAVIRIEPRKYNNSIPQCYKCQKFGHAKNYCQMQPQLR